MKQEKNDYYKRYFIQICWMAITAPSLKFNDPFRIFRSFKKIKWGNIKKITNTTEKN